MRDVCEAASDVSGVREWEYDTSSEEEEEEKSTLRRSEVEEEAFEEEVVRVFE